MPNLDIHLYRIRYRNQDLDKINSLNTNNTHANLEVFGIEINNIKADGYTKFFSEYIAAIVAFLKKNDDNTITFENIDRETEIIIFGALKATNEGLEKRFVKIVKPIRNNEPWHIIPISINTPSATGNVVYSPYYKGPMFAAFFLPKAIPSTNASMQAPSSTRRADITHTSEKLNFSAFKPFMRNSISQNTVVNNHGSPSANDSSNLGKRSFSSTDFDSQESTAKKPKVDTLLITMDNSGLAWLQEHSNGQKKCPANIRKLEIENLDNALSLEQKGMFSAFLINALTIFLAKNPRVKIITESSVVIKLLADAGHKQQLIILEQPRPQM